MMAKSRTLMYCLLMLLICNSLTGCVVLAAGAGAAGGYFAAKNYESHHNGG